MIVDSNVVIDLFEPDRADAISSARALGFYGTEHPLLIDLVIFAEVASRFRSARETEARMTQVGLSIDPLDIDIAYVAGRAFREYRRRGGPRTTILPDFVIGAHAHCRGMPILTRDRDRFESYFPELRLIDPRTLDA